MSKSRLDDLLNSIPGKILSGILYNSSYYERISSYLKNEYFEYEEHQIVHSLIVDYYTKYETRLTPQVLLISLDKLKISNQDLYNSTYALIKKFEEPKEDEKWFYETTEKFCRNTATRLAILESIGIYEGSENQKKIDEIPEIMGEAISIHFDKKLGHIYNDDFEERYKKYTNKEERLEFDIDLLNKITDGGLKKKTINLFLGSTGGCKSLTLCHCASAFLMSGKNVVYFSMEMSEDAIGERIDANLLDMRIHELKYLTKDSYLNKFNKLLCKNLGKLVIKEYPTGAANANHFKYFIKELRQKKDIVPDVIVVDYLTICDSIKSSGSGSYEKYKSVAEELRALAVTSDVPLITAVQLNRTGTASSEPTITDISESYGIASTADLAVCIKSNDELDADDELMLIQLKNRYSSLTNPKKFRVGVDKSKMRLYNLEDAGVVGQLNPGDTSIPEPEFNFDLNNNSVITQDFNFDD